MNKLHYPHNPEQNGEPLYASLQAQPESTQDSDRPRINDEIRNFKVRVIDHTGANIGVITNKEALYKARDVGLDLVEVSPQANPPVCKIMDFGKFIFEKRKKAKESIQKAPETHEIRLSPGIGIHDIEIKSRKAMEFLTDGSKVILSFKLKGRETKHPELVREVVEKFYNFVKSTATLESKGGTFTLIPK